MAVELSSSEEDVKALLKSAVSSRASHIIRESQNITMANVRRLLETDLGLEKSALDIHKAFIRQLVDEVLLSSDNVEAQEEEGEEQKPVSEEVPKKTSGSKQSKKSSGKKAREENGSVEDFEDLQEEDVHGETPKKKQKEKKRRASSKEEDEDGGGGNADMSEEEVHGEAPKKKQKEKKRRASSKEEDEDGGGSNADMSEEEVHVESPKKKQRKEKEIRHSEEVDEDGSGGHAVSEDDSDVSEVKKEKKVSPKIASVKPTQNKKIEHLKKIIKACGLIIPPQIYKRAKQQPDDRHDKFLIKELEEFLSRRGLSSNPSDKEIKAAKQKIAREKDLEGIDTTNIILEPRGRRATSQLFAPVYNPPPVEFDSEGDDEEESEDDGAEGSEDEGKEFAVAEDPEDSD